MTAKQRTDWSTRFHKMKQFLGDLRPVDIEPFAAILSKKDMEMLRVVADSMFVMRCTETGRLFVPSMCIR